MWLTDNGEIIHDLLLEVNIQISPRHKIWISSKSSSSLHINIYSLVIGSLQLGISTYTFPGVLHTAAVAQCGSQYTLEHFFKCNFTDLIQLLSINLSAVRWVWKKILQVWKILDLILEAIKSVKTWTQPHSVFFRTLDRRILFRLML